jgi:hypothetical protein
MRCLSSKALASTSTRCSSTPVICSACHSESGSGCTSSAAGSSTEHGADGLEPRSSTKPVLLLGGNLAELSGVGIPAGP